MQSLNHGMNTVVFILTLFLLQSCGLEGEYGELIPDSQPYTKDVTEEYMEIMIYGDAGNGTIDQQLTADDMALYAGDPGNDVSFIINLGDSFYPDGVDSVSDPLWSTSFEEIYSAASLNLPFYSILGNHDSLGSIEALIQYESDRWKMPALNYSKFYSITDGPAVELFFLNTEGIFYGDAEQLQWLDRALDESNADWKIVSGHRPVFSNGFGGTNSSLVIRLQSILDNRADIYFSGHEHDLQILKPVQGVYYIVNGSAAESRSTYIRENTILGTPRIGYMSLLISQSELVLKVHETGNGIIYTDILKSRN